MICISVFLPVFKRHIDKRTKKNSMDSEVQTDITSVSTPLLNPSDVASLLENASSGTGRRRGPVRKPESLATGNKSLNNKRFSKSNSNFASGFELKLVSPLKPTLGNYYANSSPAKNTQDVIEESIVPFDEQMNGGLFSEHGILNDGYDVTGLDYGYTKGNVLHPNINGLSTIDNNNEFHNSLGYDANLTLVATPKSSPLTYTDLDRVETPISQFTNSKSKGKNKSFATCEICNKTMLKATIKMHMEQIHGGENIIYKIFNFFAFNNLPKKIHYFLIQMKSHTSAEVVIKERRGKAVVNGQKIIFLFKKNIFILTVHADGTIGYATKKSTSSIQRDYIIVIDVLTGMNL